MRAIIHPSATSFRTTNMADGDAAVRVYNHGRQMVARERCIKYAPAHHSPYAIQPTTLAASSKYMRARGRGTRGGSAVIGSLLAATLLYSVLLLLLSASASFFFPLLFFFLLLFFSPFIFFPLLFFFPFYYFFLKRPASRRVLLRSLYFRLPTAAIFSVQKRSTFRFTLCYLRDIPIYTYIVGYRAFLTLYTLFAVRK